MKLSYIKADSKPCKYGSVMNKIAAINCKKAIQKTVTIMTAMSASIGLTDLCIKQIGLLLHRPTPQNVIDIGKDLFMVGYGLISEVSMFLLILIFLSSVIKCLVTNQDGKEMTWCMVGSCVGYTIIKFAPLIVTFIMNMLVTFFV